MSEYQKHEGRLEVMKKQAEKLEIRLKGLVKALRDNLDPLENVRDLEGNLIAAQAVEFGSMQSEYLDVLANIRKAKKILGRA